MSDSTTRGDVRISGAGTIATGTYRTVSVSGSATMTGDIDCIDFKISGAAEGSGTLRTENVTVQGSLGYRGDADADEVRVSGTASFRSLKANDVYVAGTLAVSSLTANSVKILGMLSIDGDCEAERFVTQGAFRITGLLNAGSIDVDLGDKCTVDEIGGEAVTVRIGAGPVKRFVTSLIPGMELRLYAESIEGDNVRLENTTARVVRGNTVVIGEGCKIDLVEYTGEYSASPDAKVAEARKVSAAESE